MIISICVHAIFNCCCNFKYNFQLRQINFNCIGIDLIFIFMRNTNSYIIHSNAQLSGITARIKFKPRRRQHIVITTALSINRKRLR